MYLHNIYFILKPNINILITILFFLSTNYKANISDTTQYTVLLWFHFD